MTINIPDAEWVELDADRDLLHWNVTTVYAAPTGRKPSPPMWMGGSQGFLLPAWIANMKSEADRDRARLRFYVRLAAIYASPAGTLSNLSIVCGLNPRALSTYTAPNSGRRRISPVVAKRIEAACGGIVTRAQIHPEAFAD